MSYIKQIVEPEEKRTNNFTSTLIDNNHVWYGKAIEQAGGSAKIDKEKARSDLTEIQEKAFLSHIKADPKNITLYGMAKETFGKINMAVFDKLHKTNGSIDITAPGVFSEYISTLAANLGANLYKYSFSGTNIDQLVGDVSSTFNIPLKKDKFQTLDEVIAIYKELKQREHSRTAAKQLYN